MPAPCARRGACPHPKHLLRSKDNLFGSQTFAVSGFPINTRHSFHETYQKQTDKYHKDPDSRPKVCFGVLRWGNGSYRQHRVADRRQYRRVIGGMIAGGCGDQAGRLRRPLQPVKGCPTASGSELLRILGRRQSASRRFHGGQALSEHPPAGTRVRPSSTPAGRIAGGGCA